MKSKRYVQSIDGYVYFDCVLSRLVAQVQGTPSSISSSSPPGSQGSPGSTTDSDAEQKIRRQVEDLLEQRMGKERSPVGKDGGKAPQGEGAGAGKKPTKLV